MTKLITALAFCTLWCTHAPAQTNMADNIQRQENASTHNYSMGSRHTDRMDRRADREARREARANDKRDHKDHRMDHDQRYFIDRRSTPTTPTPDNPTR